MKIPFAKYHGAGNDFILIDSREFTSQVDFFSLARSLCDRRLGIGADGLILLCSSSIADCKMRIFNADGSEPTMCGNGIRCLFDYIDSEKPLAIETLSGVLKCRRIEGKVCVNLGAPKILHWPIELPQGTAFVVDTGVPHAVLFVDDLENKNIVQEGATVRFNPQFAPTGVNANFVTVKSPNQIAIRTYERGVEGETLACGTGAAAAAYVAMKHGLAAPVSVMTRRDELCFQFTPQEEIEMIGPAQRVFEGFINLNDLNDVYRK